jgi:hypothetical protein
MVGLWIQIINMLKKQQKLRQMGAKSRKPRGGVIAAAQAYADSWNL